MCTAVDDCIAAHNACLPQQVQQVIHKAREKPEPNVELASPVLGGAWNMYASRGQSSKLQRRTLDPES